MKLPLQFLVLATFFLCLPISVDGRLFRAATSTAATDASTSSPPQTSSTSTVASSTSSSATSTAATGASTSSPPQTSSTSTVASSTSSSECSLLESGGAPQMDEPDNCSSGDYADGFIGVRGLQKVPGKVINNSECTIVCRPETNPPATVNVPPGGKADIDGIMLANGNIYKIVNGCTVTINPPGKTTGDLSIDCDSIKSRCAQIVRGGEVEPWW